MSDNKGCKNLHSIPLVCKPAFINRFYLAALVRIDLLNYTTNQDWRLNRFLAKVIYSMTWIIKPSSPPIFSGFVARHLFHGSIAANFLKLDVASML